MAARSPWWPFVAFVFLQSVVHADALPAARYHVTEGQFCYGEDLDLASTLAAYPSLSSSFDALKADGDASCYPAQSTVFCASPSQKAAIETICNLERNCGGYDMLTDASGLTRFFLNSWNCVFQDPAAPADASTDAKMYTKDFGGGETDCEEDVYAEVSGAGYSSVNGVYDATASANVFMKRGSDSERLFYDGCDWMVQKKYVPEVTTAVVPDAGECSDHVAAANFLLGLGGSNDPNFMPHVCSLGAASGLCGTDAVFGGLCARSCSVEFEVCTSDNNAAVQPLLERFNLVAGDCSDLCASGAGGDGDIVVQSLCQTSCPHAEIPVHLEQYEGRRLQSGDALAAISALEGNYAQAVHQDGDWLSHYLGRWSSDDRWIQWGMPQCDAASDVESLGQVPPATSLDSQGYCDGVTFPASIAGTAITSSCAASSRYYVTTHGQYMDSANVDLDTSYPSGVTGGLQCHAQCSATTASGSCKGYRPGDEIGEGRNALCVSRAECESICDAFGAECHSIEYGNGRCFVNAGGGSIVTDAAYSMATPVQAASGFLTTSGKYCAGSNIHVDGHSDACATKCFDGSTDPTCVGWESATADALCLEREACEAACSATEGCASVDMSTQYSHCHLNNADSSDCENLEDNEGFDILDLNFAPVHCEAQLSFSGMYSDLSGSYPGSCTSSSCSFAKSDASASVTLTQTEGGCFWLAGDDLMADADCSLSSDSAALASLGAAQWYLRKCPASPSVSTGHHCIGMAKCAYFSSCIVPDVEDVALELPGGPATCTDSWLTGADTFPPRAASSPLYAEMRIDNWNYPGVMGHVSLSRDELGASRVIVKNTVSDRAVVEMYRFPQGIGASVSCPYDVCDHGDLPISHLVPGSGFTNVNANGDYVSDVVKVTRYADSCSGGVSGDTEVWFEASGAPMQVYMMAEDGSSATALATTAVEDGWASVTVVGDHKSFFLWAHEDVNECDTANTCSGGRICSNTIGSYECTCPFGSSFSNGQCVEPACPSSVRADVYNALDIQDGIWSFYLNFHRGEDCTGDSKTNITSVECNAPGGNVGEHGPCVPYYAGSTSGDVDWCGVGSVQIDADLAPFRSSCQECRDENELAIMVTSSPATEYNGYERSLFVRNQSNPVPSSLSPDHIWSAPLQSLDSSSQCINLRCGTSDYHYRGGVQLSHHSVPYACQCKSLCGSKAHNGCVAWQWDGTVGQSGSCSLLSSPTDTPVTKMPGRPQGVVSPSFYSGGPDAMVAGFLPVEARHDTAFDLTFYGFGLKASPGGLMRAKLVKSDESCAAVTDSTFVRGLGCVAGGVCSPSPSAGDDSSVTFTNVRINAGEHSDYKACYCFGTEAKCSQDWHFVEIPGTLTVRPAIFHATVSDVFASGGQGAGVNRSSWEVNIEVERASLSTLSMPENWQMKIVPAATPGHVHNSRSCDNSPANTIVQRQGDFNSKNAPWNANAWEQETNTIMFSSIVLDTDSAAGSYLVCVCEQKDAGLEPESWTCPNFQPVTMSDGSPYLTVSAGSVSLPDGPFGSQRFSARAGRTNTLSIEGRGISSWADSRFALFDAPCSMDLESVLDSDAYVQSVSDDDALSLAVDIPGGMSGEFFLCGMMDGNFLSMVHYMKTIGKVTVTADVDLERRFYVYDKSSLEITGNSPLNTNDRIMLVGCQQTCGIAQPWEHVIEPAVPELDPWDEAWPWCNEKVEVWNRFAPYPFPPNCPSCWWDTVNDFARTGECPTWEDTYTMDVHTMSDGSSLGRIENIAITQTGDDCTKEFTIDLDAACGALGQEPGCLHDLSNVSSYTGMASLRFEYNDTSGGSTYWDFEADFRGLSSSLASIFSDTGANDRLRTQQPTSLYDGGFFLDTSDNIFIYLYPSSWQRNRRLDPNRWSRHGNLKFSPVHIPDGSKAKVCYCKASQAEGGKCSLVSDYNIEVGEVISTAVENILADDRQNRAECVAQQYDGGLRCASYFADEIPQYCPPADSA